MDCSRHNKVTLEDIQLNVTKEIGRDYIPTHSMEVIVALMFAGLAEEVGEVEAIYKRILRNNAKDKATLRANPDWLTEELGDVLWYLTSIAIVFNLDLESIWLMNRKKLEERYGK